MKVILVVDDEKESANLFSQIFRHQIASGEYSFLFALNADEALALFDRSARIDLIISDIRMPGIDGHAFVKEIRKRDDSVSIMMLSAYGDTGNYRKALLAGADDFLEKSAGHTEVRRSIAEILAKEPQRENLLRVRVVDERMTFESELMSVLDSLPFVSAELHHHLDTYRGALPPCDVVIAYQGNSQISGYELIMRYKQTYPEVRTILYADDDQLFSFDTLEIDMISLFDNQAILRITDFLESLHLRRR
jgi:two-component system response regulator (stage 0 sporulation protein F)